ncbi:MAG: vitamin K epoxide reductase family protein [Chloroflexota bacterium]
MVPSPQHVASNAPSARGPASAQGPAPNRAWIPAVLGLAVSLYLLITDLTNESTICLSGSDCDLVRHSQYSQVLGIPLTVVGVVFFGVATALSLLRRRWSGSAQSVLAGGGLGGAILLPALQVLALKAVCVYCVVIEVAAIAAAVIVLKRANKGLRTRSAIVGFAAAGLMALAYNQHTGNRRRGIELRGACRSSESERSGLLRRILVSPLPRTEGAVWLRRAAAALRGV